MKPKHTLKLILIYKEANDFHIEVINTIPDENYFLKDPNSSSFSGLVVVEDWEGNMLKLFEHKNGIITEWISSGEEGVSSKIMIKCETVRYLALDYTVETPYGTIEYYE